MKELSLHILDIIQNSIAANSSRVELLITEDVLNDSLRIEIIDNGKGISPELLKIVTDPFLTTRTTRKVGLGLSLFKAAAQQTGGDLDISSKEGKGTKVCAWFSYQHIDRQPIGDMGSTISNLIMSNPQIDYLYKHRFNNKEFIFETTEIKKVAGEILNNPEIILWVNEYINEGLNEIKKEEVL